MKKNNRILKNLEFQRIINLKNRIKSNEYYLLFDYKKEENSRIGISVSKKIGNAVVRNKIKRQIRMMVDEILDLSFYKYDVIIIAKNNFLFNSYENNKNILERLLKKCKIKERDLKGKI